MEKEEMISHIETAANGNLGMRRLSLREAAMEGAMRLAPTGTPTEALVKSAEQIYAFLAADISGDR